MPSYSSRTETEDGCPVRNDPPKPLHRFNRGSTADRCRRWLYRIIAATLIPLLFVFGIELGLRAAGYGYPTDFFLPINGRDAVTTNQKFGWQFFPPAIARTPAICDLAKTKDPNTFRIFILGGSAAMGNPESAFGLARYLEVMLSDSVPGLKFEFVNAAMTAINSHVVLPIARECLEYQPDLLIVYMGNNEVVGPYGPGTVFAGFSTYLPAIRASVRLKSSTLGQLINNIGFRSTQKTWRGLEMFLGHRVPADDVRLKSVYTHFRANLEDICGMAALENVETLLCTVACNLKDCPPFAAVHSDAISESDISQWQIHYDAGVQLTEDANDAEALHEFLRAEVIDAQRADLHFRLGHTYLVLEQHDKARKHIELARELDALRFRVDNEINRIIRKVAEEKVKCGINLVDVEHVFANDEATFQQLPGDEFFYEHVHMNPEGNYLLAKAIFPQIVTRLVDRVPHLASAEIELPSQQRCFDLLPLTKLDRFRLAEAMVKLTSRPPFTKQIDHDDRIAGAEEQLNRLQRESTSTEALTAARQQYRDVTEHSISDLSVFENYARLLRRCGDYVAAAEQWRSLIRRIPNMTRWHTALADIFEEAGDNEAAIEVLRHAINLDPSRAAAQYCSIAFAYLNMGNSLAAIKAFRQALKLDKDSVNALNGLGLAYRNQGRQADAIAHFQQALQIDPTHASAHNNMGNELFAQGRQEEALYHFRRAADEKPDDVDIVHNLASVLTQQGKYNESITLYRRASQLAPDRPITMHALANALVMNGQLEEAVDVYRGALRVAPEFLVAGQDLAVTLVELDRIDEAIDEFHRILKINQEYLPALLSLVVILTTHADEFRDSEQAVQLAVRACKLTQYKDAAALEALAVAYVTAGDHKNAQNIAEQALLRARESGNKLLVQRVEARLREFEN